MNRTSPHTHMQYSPRNHTHPEYAARDTVTGAARSGPVISAGAAAVPTLIGSQQVTISVGLRVPMADTAYQAVPVLSGAVSLLAALSVVSWSIVTASRVDVVVRNTGLLTLSGAVLLVTALHD